MKQLLWFPLFAAVFLIFESPLYAKPRHRSREPVSASNHPFSRDDEKITHFEFKHVNYRVDETVILQIEILRGELLPAKEGTPPTFDDRDTLLLIIEAGEAAMSTSSFATLMNRYVFNYRGTPLTNVRATPEGDQLHVTATLHKFLA